MQICNIYLEVCESLLLVVRAPYGIKGEELGHSHFYRMASMRNVGGVKYHPWILHIFFEKEERFTYCLAFCFLTTALTTAAKVSQLYT